MPSLKIFKSVAHNLAHHFSSTLSYWKSDYTINHLGNASKKFKINLISIDILNNTIEPEILNQGVIKEFLPQYQIFLNNLLKTHSLEDIELESIIIQYDFSPSRKTMFDLPTYDSISTIITKSGRKFEALLTEES